MNSRVKAAIFNALEKSGAYTVARALKAGPIILFYHGVEDRILDARVQTLHMQTHHFEKQIQYLKRNFEIISIDNLYGSIRDGIELNSRHIVLTFDDGYANNLSIVAPFLDALNMPFAVFVSTNHIESGMRFPTYILRAAIYCSEMEFLDIQDIKFNIRTDSERCNAVALISRLLKSQPITVVNRIIHDLRSAMPAERWSEIDEKFSSDQPMTWKQVRQLQSFGAVIGSHCHDHFLLHEQQSIKDIQHQLTVSRSLVKEHVGDCDHIAYPNGRENDVTSTAMAMAREAGYATGVTTIPGEVLSHSDPLFLPRICGDVEDFSRFKFIVNTGSRLTRQN